MTAPPLESSEEALKAFEVGVAPSVVDEVPVRDEEAADFSDALALVVVTFTEEEAECLDDDEPAEKPPDGVALAELRTTCCDE